MKRILTTMALLAALAGSASAYSYILPGQQPGAYTDNDWQPVYAVEGIWNIAQNDMPDTYGVRGSFNVYSGDEGSAFTHQFSLNVAAAWGSETYRYDGGYSEDVDAFILPITAGYNLNIALSDVVTLTIGAKAGYAWGKAEYSEPGYSDKEDGGGFTYSVGGGLKFQCTDAINVHAGYEFGRSYLDFDIPEENHTIYGAHTIYLGVGGRF